MAYFRMNKPNSSHVRRCKEEKDSLEDYYYHETNRSEEYDRRQQGNKTKFRDDGRFLTAEILIMDDKMASAIQNTPGSIRNLLVTQICAPSSDRSLTNQSTNNITPRFECSILNSFDRKSSIYSQKQDHICHKYKLHDIIKQKTLVSRHQWYEKEWAKYSYLGSNDKLYGDRIKNSNKLGAKSG